MTAHRPRRHKKADTLLHSGATREAIRVDYATGPFDEEARRMDVKWGVDRLPNLVPPEVADKYGRALDALNQAIRDQDPEKTAWAATNCVKGMRKMDEIAEAAGQPKADPDAYIEHDHDGLHFLIMKDERFWPAIREKRPGAMIVTLREVGIALAALKDERVAEIKRAFEDAEITAIRPKGKTDEIADDAIPF